MRVKIFSLILMFFFLFGLYSQEGEWWVGKTIKSIDFEGLVNISKSDLDGITKPYKGQVFTYELYQELLGALFALDYFDNIETAAVKGDDNYNTVILNFIVQEKPVVSFIELVGNSKVRRSDILSAITIFFAPLSKSSLQIAIPALPAPQMTMRTSLSCFCASLSAFSSAAVTTIAVPC